MKKIVCIFLIMISATSALAQTNPMLEKIKEIAKLKKELEAQKKIEWDAYLQKVAAHKAARLQKKQADSISKAYQNVALEKDKLPVCTNMAQPYFMVPNATTGQDDKIPYSSYVRSHIVARFHYPKFAREHNIEGTVIVHFKVNEDGKVTVIDAIGPVNGLVLEEEATKIITSLKQATPAHCDDKIIAVKYTLPIVFKMMEEDY